MGMWTAPSDRDYYDEGSRGVRYECSGCGRDVFVSRSEPYPGPRVWCESCQEEWRWCNLRQDRTEAARPCDRADRVTLRRGKDGR